MEDPRDWKHTLSTTLVEMPNRMIDRVEVLEEVGSTQDEAFRLAGRKPGLLLLALRQVAGRGRLGRPWHAAPRLGLTATFVLDASRLAREHLSLAAGLAVAWAIDGLGPEPFGLRWPNDVVEPLPREGGGRKIAGVLIEVRDGLALVGIGINILQQESDFPPELRNKAVSLSQLGGTATRLEVASGLLRALHRTLTTDPRTLALEWTHRDVLTGSSQVFDHNGQRYAGIVESIDPTHEIILRTGPESVVRLPAATTSLVRD